MLLAQWEKEKKYKYCNNCHEQQKHFSPYFLFVGGMLGKEALVVLAYLSRLMAAKME